MEEFPSSSPPSTSCSPPPFPSLPPSMKENGAEVGSMLPVCVSESPRLQEMQSWRSKLDTQVKTYQNEISVLKSSLGSEVELLKSEFEGLKATLQQHQEDVTNSLKSCGIEDASKEHEDLKETENTEKADDGASGDVEKTEI